MGNHWYILGATLTSVALFLLSRVLFKSADAEEKRQEQESRQRFDELHEIGIELLMKIERWRTRHKMATVEDEHEWIRRQEEFKRLRPHLGREPSIRMFSVTQSGLESGFVAWLTKRIDDFAKPPDSQT